MGREKQKGRILLAVEVDSDWNEESILKLADTNALLKAWVVVDGAKEYEGSLAWFEWAKGALKEWLETYGNIQPGEFVFFYKGVDFLKEARLL